MYPSMLNDILQDLIAIHPHISGAEIVSREGISLVSQLSEDMETDWMAPESHHVLNLALHTVQLTPGQFSKFMSIHYQHKQLVIAPCQREAAIMVWLKSACDLPKIQDGLERAVRQMQMII